MNELARFRAAVIAWAADGNVSDADDARQLSGAVHTVVLAEGVSDQAAIAEVARLRGRDLEAEGHCVIPVGGATSIGRFLGLLGPAELKLPMAGLCDAAEERFFQRALERAELGTSLTRATMESLGFFVCVADLEDELIRALGIRAAEDVLDTQDDLRAFRTFQRQPAQRTRTTEQQLHRFIGTTSGRKAHYARWLVRALEPDRVPRPLDELVAQL